MAKRVGFLLASPLSIDTKGFGGWLPSESQLDCWRTGVVGSRVVLVGIVVGTRTHIWGTLCNAIVIVTC